MKSLKLLLFSFLVTVVGIYEFFNLYVSLDRLINKIEGIGTIAYAFQFIYALIIGTPVLTILLFMYLRTAKKTAIHLVERIFIIQLVVLTLWIIAQRFIDFEALFE